MAAIESRLLHAPSDAAALWPRVAAETRAWLVERGADMRSACVLVPFAELLPLARRAFAQVPGWLPRLHTTRTLLHELAPAFQPTSDDVPSGRPAIDALIAARLLRRFDWGAAWARRDRRSFDHAVALLTRTTHAQMQAASALAAAQRAAFWERARAVAAPTSGPTATDAALQRIAVEWAAAAAPPETDRLSALHPSAWIVVEIGGEGDSALPWVDAADATPCLRLCLDPAAEDPFDQAPDEPRVELLSAADGETEAHAAAHAVVEAVAAGAAPVALIAADRAGVRRIRALLERSGIRMVDETGWSLATTRAGADAITALRAAHPGARPDDRLDWLKSRSGAEDDAGVARLEALWRASRTVDAASRAAAQGLWSRERARLDAFAAPGRRSLSRWLAAFDALLSGARGDGAWLNDPAVEQLRRTLWLDPGARDAGAERVLDQPLDLDEFTAWVEAGLEQARFVPPPASRDDAAVVVTPLLRAIGRPFATVVLPGADERRLALNHERELLFGDAALRALGLPDRAQRRRRQALAFVHLLHAPKVVIVRRRADGDEALGPSLLIDRLQSCRQARGQRPLVEREVQLPQREVPRVGITTPQPTARGRLPPSLSASAAEALRQCPYRFFARSVLGLQEPDELVDDADKGDYGRWLHATLERFHATRGEPRPAAAEAEHLQRCGDEVLRALIDAGDVTEAALLPYLADLPALARRYLAWLAQHEARGWRFEAAEVTRRVGDADGDLQLHGRIDRVDVRADGRAVHLIDYKTSARSALARKVARPLEDTQLAVYGALLVDSLAPGTELSAAYLALDEREAVRPVEHPQVAESARRLRRELAAERDRIEAGAALPALGQGAVCETCEARGLCRRDHWAVPAR